MDHNQTFRLAFDLLFALLIGIRLYFLISLKKAGENLAADSNAINREGFGIFAVRLVGFILFIGVLIIYIGFPNIAMRFNLFLPNWIRWCGGVLGFLSLFMLIWIQMTLGRHWSTNLQLKYEHKLVTSGPYKRVRHPMYTSLFAVFVAFSLVSANWLIIIPSVLAILVLYVRIAKEELMLLEQFGEEYLRYVQETGKLFPKIG